MAPIRCCFDQTAVWHSDAARGPSTPSFDHLVGAGEQRWRNIEADCLGRDQIDDKIIIGRLLDRQIARLGAVQDLVHVLGGTAEKRVEIRPIRHERAGLSMLAGIDDSREPRTRRKCEYACTIGGNEPIDHHVKCVGLSLECLEGGRDIFCSPNFKFDHFDTELAGCSLNLTHFQYRLAKINIRQDRQTAQSGDDFVQDLEPPAREIDPLVRQTGDVAAGRDKLATRPPPMGSVASTNTIGTTDVACFNRGTALPPVTMRSTLRRTNSAAISAKRSRRPSPQRYSIATVRPSLQPRVRSRCTNVAIHGCQPEAAPVPRKPMVGSLPTGCCPLASIGHAAAPPSTEMNARRRMSAPPQA